MNDQFDKEQMSHIFKKFKDSPTFKPRNSEQESKVSSGLRKSFQGYTVMKSMVATNSISKSIITKSFSGEMLLLNKYDKEQFKDKQTENIFKLELKIHNSHNSKNLLKVHEFFEDKESYYAITDYHNMGSLSNYIKKQNTSKLPEPKIVFFLVQLIAGMSVLRDKKVFSRYFSLDNIFINSNDVESVCIGFVSLSDIHVPKNEAIVKSYIPYELLLAEISEKEININNKMDLWCLGCVLYEMFVGLSPFKGGNKLELLNCINRTCREDLKLPHTLSYEAKELLKGLIQPDPVKRMSWKGLLTSSIFKKYKLDMTRLLPLRYCPTFPNIILTELSFWITYDESMLEKKLSKQKHRLNGIKEDIGGFKLMKVPNKKRIKKQTHSSGLYQSHRASKTNVQKNSIYFNFENSIRTPSFDKIHPQSIFGNNMFGSTEQQHNSIIKLSTLELNKEEEKGRNGMIKFIDQNKEIIKNIQENIPEFKENGIVSILVDLFEAIFDRIKAIQKLKEDKLGWGNSILKDLWQKVESTPVLVDIIADNERISYDNIIDKPIKAQDLNRINQTIKNIFDRIQKEVKVRVLLSINFQVKQLLGMQKQIQEVTEEFLQSG